MLLYMSLSNATLINPGYPSSPLKQQVIGGRVAELPEEVRTVKSLPQTPQRHAPPARPIIPGSPHMETPARWKKKKKLLGGLASVFK